MHICMNWDPVTFDWNQVRAFLATAEEGSLSAAARALGQSQPTLGRQVAALEEELGVVLFERVGRSLALTPTGRDLLEHVREMRTAAEKISLIATGQSTAVEGKVSISASDAMATYLLPPLMKQIRSEAPGIEIEIIASNEISDLQRREADIAIRHVRPEAPELYARSMGDEGAHLYATTAYLDVHGRPQSQEDLARHDFIGAGDNARMVAELERRGLSVSIDQFKLTSANGLVMWELMRQGLGIAPMSDRIAARFPEVERVLPDFEIRFPVWVAVHKELRTTRRIRIVFDLLVEHLTGL